MRSTNLTIIAAVALLGLVGCGAQQPGAPATTVTPAEQCELVQAGVDTAGVSLDFVKVKDATARAALNAALTGVESAAADFCDAVQAGAAPDAVATALRAYRAALKDFRAQLRAARKIPAT